MNQRSAISAALLSFFIPFYVLYWLYDTGKDLLQRGAPAPRFILLLGPLAGLLAVTLLQMVIQSSMQAGVAPAVNIISTLLGSVLVIAGIICPFIYYYRFSKAAEQATGGKVSTIMGFLCFVLLSPVAVYIIQDALNGSGEAMAGSQSPLPPTAA